MSGPVLVAPDAGAIALALRLRSRLDDAEICGDAPEAVHELHPFGETLPRLYRQDRAIVGLCAADRLIRALAPAVGPAGGSPVVAVAADGVAVPLLGAGAEALAERIGAAVRSIPAARSGGRMSVVGLGPGSPAWLTPEADIALAEASDLVGYTTYLDRVAPRAGQARHASDNREELARAHQAIALAGQGRDVALVSSGDPGIFAMAAALIEAIEAEPAALAGIAFRVVPGLSAMQAVAARAGAPLGHDFVVISLSDRLKPWEAVARRLKAAASADFAVALYNPASKTRRDAIAAARSLLLEHRAPDTPVVIGRDVGGQEEHVEISTLGGFDADAIDMRTLLIVGASHTRLVVLPDGRRLVYTPRRYGAHSVNP